MFSSDDGAFAQETLEEGVQTELPSDSPPEKPKRNRKAKSLTKTEGRPRVLSFAERVEAWHDYTLGANIYELAIKFLTQPNEIQAGIDLVAKELGYPHNHIDPELERFRIVEASDRMKSVQIQLLQKANQTLKEIEQQQSRLKEEREDIHIGRDTSKDELKLLDAIMKAEAELELRHQSEVKSIVSLMAEYRATNLVIADLTGIKRTKPVRKPKQLPTAEEALENLSDEQLIELTKVG